MNLNKQEVEMAIGAGMELLGPNSSIVIPAKLNDGVFLLKQLLHGIGTGSIGLAPVMQPKPEVAPPEQLTTPSPAESNV